MGTISENEVVSARELITPNRFDVCAKHAYARLRELSPGLEWGTKVYDNHVLALNQVIGNGKYRSSNFLTAFGDILDSIKVHGFDPSQSVIPINDNGDLCDGAHRTAACLLYNVMPTIERYKAPQHGCLYTWEFFKRHGLEENVLDYMALEYCRLRDDCFLAIIWPSAVGHVKSIERRLADECTIVYRKEVPVTGSHAPKNIISQVYPKTSWLGRAKDRYRGRNIKERERFIGARYLYVYLLQSESSENVIRAKEKARAEIGLGKHSLHTTNDYLDTVMMTRIFFNTNSINFVNHATLIDSPIFHERLIEYAAAVGAREDFAIHGSAVMEAFGIRNADDLDYISRSGQLLSCGDPKISLGNEKVKHGEFTMDDLLFDPRRHFYFYGVKFVNLEVTERMKATRKMKKDKRDIELIRCWRQSSICWKFYQASRVLRYFFPGYKRWIFQSKAREAMRQLRKKLID